MSWFFIRWLVLHSQFLDLGNLVKTVMYHLLIGRMICLRHSDEFLMVSALVCTITHWTWPMVNRDIRILIFMIHHTILSHIFWTLREYWAYAKINRRFWPNGDTLMWLYILIDWVIIDGSWLQQIFSISWYLMGLR